MIMFGHHTHKVPGLNTTSTADISFMLLIFFLVTTSMDTDKGLTRQLPPMSQNKTEQADVNKNKVMTLNITSDNQLMCNGQTMPFTSLRQSVKDFIQRTGRQHIISVSVDRNADYNTYFNMQNEIVGAYNELRDSWAMRKFGRNFNQCSDTQKDVVKKVYPQRISESNDGGGQ